MVWLSKIVQNLFTILVTDATWMICCHVSLSTGCTNDTVDQGYLFRSKPMSSKFRFLTSFSLWLRISAIPSGEWRTALASCPSTPSNSLPRNYSSPGLSSSSSDSVTSAIAKAVDFFCLSSLKCTNNTSRPRCTQYRFDPFFIKYTDLNISGLNVDQMTYHFPDFNFF